MMRASEPAGAATHVKSRFLDGLAPLNLRVVLAAARERYFAANSVVVGIEAAQQIRKAVPKCAVLFLSEVSDL